MLRDPARCQVVLVTLPEETPVNEAIETAYALEEEVGVALGPIVVNGVYEPLVGLDRPPRTGREEVRAALGAAAELRRTRQAHQHDEQARLAASLPLEQLTLPFLFTPTVGVAESALLAEALLAGIRALPDHVVRSHG